MHESASSEWRQCLVDYKIQSQLEKKGFNTEGEAKKYNFQQISGKNDYFQKPSNKKYDNWGIRVLSLTSP